jgi:hypothetical protein
MRNRVLRTNGPSFSLLSAELRLNDVPRRRPGKEALPDACRESGRARA